ncbi:hypothetical protein [Sphingomonas guangdongensis]|uniref:hypothetical protein n=1 Tax=Sphingomonas guangdongensis TaxID=1141890 RepID=UPI000BE48AA3|nr:hypothetical protein [Sphingomonas guangdongensis]
MEQIHPQRGERGGDRVRAIGEVAYMAELSHSVRTWIATHPAAFAWLCFRHIRQMIAPEPFQFELGSGSAAAPRSIIFSVLSVIGLLTLFALSFQRWPGWIYPTIVLVTLIASYAPFQPMARYLYLTYGLVTYAAFFGVALLVTRLRGRKANKLTDDPSPAI